MYLFDAASGNTVADYSGVEPPLDLTIANPSAVSWLPDGGLAVNNATIIQSGSPAARLFDALTNSDEVTLEAWVVPNNTNQNGPARILTLSQDAFFRNFTLSQEFSTFEIRLRTTTTDDNGFPPLPSPAGGATTNLSHIVYARRDNGQARLYIDNSVVATEARDGSFSNWNDQYHLALANELTLDRPWLGTFQLVAIYDRYLSVAEVAQNYQAGPRPFATQGQEFNIYLPAVQGLNGCGESTDGAGESAVFANTRDTDSPTIDRSPAVLAWLIGLTATLLVAALSAVGLHTLRARPQP